MTLPKRHGRGSHGDLAGAEQIIRRGRDAENRSDAPGEAADALGRRQEETLRRIAQPELRSRTGKDVALVNDRNDGPRDEVPVLVDREGHDRLEVHIELLAILLRTDPPIIVELEGNAYKIRDRVR